MYRILLNPRINIKTAFMILYTCVGVIEISLEVWRILFHKPDGDFQIWYFAWFGHNRAQKSNLVSYVLEIWWVVLAA